MSSPRVAVGVCLFAVLALSSVFGQNPPTSSPQAVAYAAESIAALTGGITISDVTLTGSVTWNGSESGTATLLVLGMGESRMDLALAIGTRTEIRDAQTGVPLGQWIAPSNASGLFAPQNCATDAAWFFPALGSLAAGPNVVLSYIGQQTWNGTNVQHIQSYVYNAIQPPPGPGPSSQQLSTMDFYLDATSLLPVAITFNAHPDNNSGINLPVETDFSNYQTIGGITVPMHIQKYQQGDLMIDVVVSGAAFNTGLQLSIFTVN
jgi:hypothetical protein